MEESLTFDLTDPNFLVYAEDAGVLYLAGVDERFSFTANHAATKEEFFDIFRYAEKQDDGSEYRFSDKEMEIHWRIMLSAKKQLQDCWDKYNQQ